MFPSNHLCLNNKNGIIVEVKKMPQVSNRPIDNKLTNLMTPPTFLHIHHQP
jgi:hypothetical protein